MRSSLLGTVMIAVVACGGTSSTAPAPAAPAPAAPAPAPSGWTAFAPPGGEFSVLLPGAPQVETQQQETAVGAVPMTTYSVELEDGWLAYMVSVTEYPASVQADAESMLDGGRDGMVQAVGAELTAEERIEVGGHPGRDLDMRTPEGFHVRARVVLVYPRLYQLLVVATDQTYRAEDVERFFASFALRR
jgi:hypothetical protein